MEQKKYKLDNVFETRNFGQPETVQNAKILIVCSGIAGINEDLVSMDLCSLLLVFVCYFMLKANTVVG